MKNSLIIILVIVILVGAGVIYVKFDTVNVAFECNGQMYFPDNDGPFKTELGYEWRGSNPIIVSKYKGEWIGFEGFTAEGCQILPPSWRPGDWEPVLPNN